ncbi:SDR family oxidoreductase [Arthrobacter sp. MI7-26]|uniref:SDR family NAD(P)-dependent oxidoreductase n=1 Tax=Arthrobacter sp. MI7-26 TaxID=2993653 RepID=UPI00224925EB|nr:SDR family NAD(P)-dependent oxidoreductase [Arthrobacter sp. MI7-26]MCX2750337.1 SDR family oxidoreductase [Arthrobacter sp. MI7-26]
MTYSLGIDTEETSKDAPELPVFPMSGIQGRRTLVVGGGSGIGRGIALAFGRLGAKVIVSDRELTQAEAVAQEITDEGGCAASFFVDVADPSSVTKLRDDVFAALTSVDVVVHAAGIGSASLTVDLTDEEWSQMIAVNLTGPFLITRAFLPHMMERRDGRVIIVSSQLGLIGASGLSHYCAAKSGVHGFVKSVAREVAEYNVLVNAIAPGPTDTPLLRLLPADVRNGIRQDIPLKRIGTIDEIVPTAVLLASEGGSYYTGAVLSPCGGHAMP